MFKMGLLQQAWELRIPKVVQLRMLINVAIDTAIGAVPLVGDLFDFAWKANDMNLTLLERHGYEEHRASAGDWAFIALMIVLVLAIAALPFVVLGALVSSLR